MVEENKQYERISRRDFLGGVVGGSVATVLVSGISSCAVEKVRFKKAEAKIGFPETNLPILHRADVIIAGGSFAGIAAALEFAQDGKRVVLIESRTYLGREITATLRPWVNLGKLEQAPEPIAACLKAMEFNTTCGNIPLKLDTVKRTLEDMLLNAGVEFLYASQPVGVLVEDGAVGGLIIGNKSGRQVITGKIIIDASETAVVARVAGAEFETPSTETFKFNRTIEFDGVQTLNKRSLSVPKIIGIAGNEVSFHHGYRGEGHIYVECPMVLQYGNMDVGGLMTREIEARGRTMRLASYLINNMTEFKKANLATTSYELYGRHTTCLAGPVPKWALDFDSVSFGFTNKNLKKVKFSTSGFAGPVRNLWCLQEAARLKLAQMELINEPVSASLTGSAFAKSLIAQWDQTGTFEGTKQSKVTGSSTGGMEIKQPTSPQRGRLYEQQVVALSEVPVLRTADVLVVGGGTSGATAAITSAKEGVRTVLLELNPGLGGTGTLGGVDSYWFGRRVGFNRRVKQLVDREHKALNFVEEEWPRWNIEAKMHALLKEAKRVGAEVFFNAITIGTIVEGNQVRGVVAAGKFGVFAVLAKVVIDATGDGDVAAFAGAKYTYGSTREHAVMWFSLAQFVKPGYTQNNFTSMVDVSNIEDYTRAILAGRRRGPDCHDHGVYIASRETRHIKGSVVLTLTDQLRQRQWDDVINIHYSNCDLKGKTASDWFRMGLIPPNLEIEIPYRSLLPEGLENILVAGKAISAKHDALPAIRMQADLENLGGVVALAAAQAVREKVSPRQINIAKLQKRLVKAGLLPKEVLQRKTKQKYYNDGELKALVESLSGEKPLYSYSVMKMGEVFREKIPIVEVCSASCGRVVPILEESLSQAQGKRRVLLAQALAMFESTMGVAELVAEIEQHLAGDKLPARTSEVLYTQRPPDQGAMPDVVYLIYSLGMTRDRRNLAIWDKVTELLSPTEEDFNDRYKGTFYYVDAVCYGAELLGQVEAVPILNKIHSYACLRNLVIKDEFQRDFVHERRAFLEVSIGRALVRCGSSVGIDILISYLDDNRAILAEFAHTTLVAIAGRDYGKDSRAWRSWLNEVKDSFKPCPLLERLDG
ncbi:MAG: FAD-dependent oxidoreductase [Planctomycetota bacterium]|nr:MAG: FAD-dependent oxidoreductase [Planctomycetota bacterium]